MNGERSVLIVDRSEETREVLQTVLERHGVHTITAGYAAMGAELVRRHHPDLVVLDLEIEDFTPENFCESQDFFGDFERPKTPETPQFVLLGSLRRQSQQLPGGEFVAKPYHYGLLVRKIEELLDSRTREAGTCRRCSSSAEPIKETASS